MISAYHMESGSLSILVKKIYNDQTIAMFAYWLSSRQIIRAGITSPVDMNPPMKRAVLNLPALVKLLFIFL